MSPERNMHPNPNNPMEYCSTVPPLLQVAGSSAAAPSVMVPVGVLKREGKSETYDQYPFPHQYFSLLTKYICLC